MVHIGIIGAMQMYVSKLQYSSVYLFSYYSYIIIVYVRFYDAYIANANACLYGVSPTYVS